jgi:integrase
VDGGELSPLTVEEQATILKALQKSSREYQLMFYLAFFTGARLQTICTLRIKCLLNREPDSHGLFVCLLELVQALILNFKSQ